MFKMKCGSLNISKHGVQEQIIRYSNKLQSAAKKKHFGQQRNFLNEFLRKGDSLEHLVARLSDITNLMQFLQCFGQFWSKKIVKLHIYVFFNSYHHPFQMGFLQCHLPFLQNRFEKTPWGKKALYAFLCPKRVFFVTPY